MLRSKPAVRKKSASAFSFELTSCRSSFATTTHKDCECNNCAVISQVSAPCQTCCLNNLMVDGQCKIQNHRIVKWRLNTFTVYKLPSLNYLSKGPETRKMGDLPAKWRRPTNSRVKKYVRGIWRWPAYPRNRADQRIRG